MAHYSEQSFLNQELDASSLTECRIAIVCAKWNSGITSKMKDAALRKLIQSGIKESMIEIWDVPGTFELVYAANKMAIEGFDAIICLGCVIQGETRHFDFICKSVAMGIQELVIKHNKPIAFGILTTDNLKQAEERAGGLKGNKGEEAASTILQLLLK